MTPNERPVKEHTYDTDSILRDEKSGLTEHVAVRVTELFDITGAYQ